MIIYDFDTEERLSELQESFTNVKLIKDSMADNRSCYRQLANDIEIDFSVIDTCCNSFERNLLIDAYTYSEQLVKNFYYMVLEKDSSDNQYLSKYLESKIPAERFSPNVNYDELEKGIKRELVSDFKFLVRSRRSEIISYNELVRSRHTYAHRGRYVFNNDFNDVINVEKYITKELEMLAGKGIEYRIQFQNDTALLRQNASNIWKMVENYIHCPNIDFKRNILYRMSQFRSEIKIYLGNYNDFWDSNVLLSNTHLALIEMANADLRRFRNVFNIVQTIVLSFKEETQSD